MGYRIAVAHTPTEEERKIFQECLGDVAEITYMAELPREDRIETLQEADVIVSTSFLSKEIGTEELVHITRANFIQLIFAGADAVPFEQLPGRIVVASNTGVFAEPLAEHVLAMILALAKSLHQRHELLARGVFDQSTLSKFLRGKVCGIVGFGGNGKQIAKLMRALGLRIYGVNRSGKTNAKVDFIGTIRDLQKVLEASNVIVLAVPLTRETRHLIGERELKWMEKDAILINVARGDVIDQGALYKHMKANPDFQVGIDTWWSEPSTHGAFHLDHPFFELPNLIGSPHVADHVPGMMPEATKKALENVRAYLLGGKVRGIMKRRNYM